MEIAAGAECSERHDTHDHHPPVDDDRGSDERRCVRPRPRASARSLSDDNVTEPEQTIIDHLGLRTEPLQQVRDDFDGVVARTLAWADDFDRQLVHVDVDVLDFERFPIAENTDLRGGLEVAELAALMSGLTSAPNWRALTLTEVNPAHAPNERNAISTLVTMVVDALGTRAPSRPQDS